MSMKRASLALAAVGLVALAAVPAADAKTGHHGCAARGTRTVADNGRARIYTRRGKHGNVFLFGCLRSNGRKTRLGFRGDCAVSTSVSKIRLAGRYAGYVETTCNIDLTNAYVVVRDLRTGRARWSAEGATGTPDPDTGDHSSEVADFDIRRNGSAVWIGIFIQSIGGDPTDRQVRKLEPGSPPGGTLVDSGLDIVKGSLGLSQSPGSRPAFYYWRKGSSTFSDTLH
jgi:hypothetical protein